MTHQELLDQSLEELEAQLHRHQRFVRGVLDGRTPGEAECPWSQCRHRAALLRLASEAVRVLDETRKAFKSKQLEVLRKDFMRVLEEELQGEEAAPLKPRLG